MLKLDLVSINYFCLLAGPGSSDSLSAEESVDKDDESVKKAKELAEKMMKSGNDS